MDRQDEGGVGGGRGPRVLRDVEAQKVLDEIL